MASYLRLVSYAALAGDTERPILLQKAVDLAPKAQRKQVEKQAEALKKPRSNSGRLTCPSEPQTSAKP